MFVSREKQPAGDGAFFALDVLQQMRARARAKSANDRVETVTLAATAASRDNEAS